MHNNRNEATSKVRFPSSFTEACNKTATVGVSVKGVMCTDTISFQKDLLLDERHSPNALFQLHKIERNSNATEKDTSFHQTPMNKELTLKASQKLHCSNEYRK